MNIDYLDRSVNPGEDFYKFATGNWIKYNKQPDDKPSWGSFDVLAENVLVQLRDLIDEMKNDNDVISRKISDFHSVMTNYDKRNSEGFAPLKVHLDKIDSLERKEDVHKYLVREMLTEIFFSTGIGPDNKNAVHNEVHMNQSLLLGNKEYYTSNIIKTKETMVKYKEVAKKVLLNSGYDESVAVDMIETYFRYEQKIAEVAYSYEKLDKPEENYNMMTLEEASKAIDFNLKEYLSWLDMNETDKIIICQPEPIKAGIDIIKEMSLDDFKKCVKFYLIMENCCLLSEDYGEIMFEFTQFMTGAKKRTEKWKRIVKRINNLFSESIGKKYAERYFSGNAKRRMVEMIGNIISAYRDIISEQEWMSEQTKKYAIEKLNSMTYKIAYPDKWKDYSDMPIDTNKNYFELCLELSKYFHKRSLKEYYNKDVDKDEWPMFPQTVNACYMPTMNEICFPAGILQSPFFDKDADDAVNYGAIGVVIAHEITHGFDTCGRLFDIDGNMKDWWTEEDSEKFNSLTENTKNHFNELNVLSDLKCDGELTLNENLADYGGLKIAMIALEKVMENVVRETGDLLNMKDEHGEHFFSEKFINEKYGLSRDGFTWKQRFFLSYANVWAGVETEEIIRNSTLNNCHSVHYMRVNGTLPMFDEWYEAWDLNKENCPMFVEKEKRAKIW